MAERVWLAEDGKTFATEAEADVATRVYLIRWAFKGVFDSPIKNSHSRDHYYAIEWYLENHEKIESEYRRICAEVDAASQNS